MENPIFLTKNQISKKKYLELKEIFDTSFDNKKMNILDKTIFCLLLENQKILSFLCIISTSDLQSDTPYYKNLQTQGLTINDSYIYNVCVHKDYRRNGYAKKILESSHNYIKNMKKDSVFLFVDNGNIPAICLYNKYNYKVHIASLQGFVMKKII